MATATATATAITTATTEMQPTIVVKRPGPPVPPRPKTTATLTTTTTAATSTATTPPIIQKKPTFVSQLSAVGRTLVYKSPSLQLPKKQAQTQTPTMALVATATKTATIAATLATPSASATATAVAPATAPKPALKLRKAPDVPTAKPRETIANTISINRANSLSAQSTPLKEMRLSLGKMDFERAGLQPTTQPLPKPRKIVQMPVATLDLEDLPARAGPVTTPSGGIFRRSKTTLDSPLSGSSSGGGGSSFLGGKTVEIKNNLKNAAERLFSEIIISQTQKQTLADTTIITKHERAIQHQALLEQELAQERQKRLQVELERERVREREKDLERAGQIEQVTIQAAGNCTRININPSVSNVLATTQVNTLANFTANPIKSSVSAGNTPEKKHAFHELLISELAAMRNRSCSLEHLSSKSISLVKTTNGKSLSRPRYNSIDDADTEDVDADNVEDADGDEEDTLTYAVNKSLKDNATLNGSSTPRKRCPSGCSSDSSPYGTERSQRIRTSDWIEVGDNGKQVTLTSCHISLEDSGMEDEERLDDMSSSGVGDSWDSVKEAENEKRCRNVKRGMSISGLPPLPKSLSGFNKLLGSDSGLLSDVDAQLELEGSNNNNDNKENESGNILASQKVSDNKSNNNNNINSNNNNNSNNDKQATKDSNKDNTSDKSLTDSVAIATTKATTSISNPSENENNSKTTTTTKTILTTSSPAKFSATGSTLDAQIATLRKEMNGLRQLDLSLLSQLWALNDSIQEFRTMIEEQDDEEDDDDIDLDEQGNRRHSPTPSSYDSVSSEGGAEADLVMQAKAKAKRLGTIPKVITTQPKQQQQAIKADMKPVPRMRSAPPPPPPAALMCSVRKAAAPPRPT